MRIWLCGGKNKQQRWKEREKLYSSWLSWDSNVEVHLLDNVVLNLSSKRGIYEEYTGAHGASLFSHPSTNNKHTPQRANYVCHPITGPEISRPLPFSLRVVSGGTVLSCAAIIASTIAASDSVQTTVFWIGAEYEVVACHVSITFEAGCMVELAAAINPASSHGELGAKTFLSPAYRLWVGARERPTQEQ